MSHITILCSFCLAGLFLGVPRLQNSRAQHSSTDLFAIAIGSAAVVLSLIAIWHWVLGPNSPRMGLGSVAALIGLEVGIVALASTFLPRLRGISAILFVTAGVLSIGLLGASAEGARSTLSMPLKVHAISSLVAYSLLAVGAILAVCALYQDMRLRRAQTGGWIQLLPPLSETERLVFALAIAGFVALTASIATGVVFVSDLFAQHLVHKTILSIVAFCLFGALLIGRALAGWRGKSALYLYLWGFVILILAYFGTRFVLEVVLNRQWG